MALVIIAIHKEKSVLSLILSPPLFFFAVFYTAILSLLSVYHPLSLMTFEPVELNQVFE